MWRDSLAFAGMDHPADHLTRQGLAARWTPALLGWLAGSAGQLTQAQLWPATVYMTFMLVALSLIAGVAINVKFFAPAAWALRGLGLGLMAAVLAFGLTGWRASEFVARTLQPAQEGRDLVVTGQVDSLPQPFALGLRFRFAPHSAQWQGQSVELPARLDLAWYGAATTLAEGMDETQTPQQRLDMAPRAGERWRFTVRLKAVHGSVNPHGFDHELWQWEQGVQASGYVRTGIQDPVPQRLQASAWYTLDHWREVVRVRVHQQVADTHAAGLIAALAMGDQRAIDRDDWEVFRATGVAHLMSISGLHITMFAWLAGLAAGALWRRSAWLCLRLPATSAALLAGVGLALLYALFSGWGVPAQRTVLMLTVVALLRLGGVRWPWPQVWLLTCVVVLMADPWALLQPGFWLSFVAVGVLFASSSGASRAEDKRVTARIWSLLREQSVITLGLAPLSLVLFGQVSLLGLPANALAIPWVTLLVTPAALLGIALPGLWDLGAWASALMLAVLRWLADLPWSTLTVPQAPAWAAALAVLGGVVLALRLPSWLRLTAGALLLPLLLWQNPAPAPAEFELLAVDVGQGSATLVRTARHALLFDAGPRYSPDSDAGARVLLPLLRALGVQLDTLVLSHQDSDHIGGAAVLLAMQPQVEVLSPFVPDASVLGSHTLRDCVAGQRWQWDGVEFAVLHPQAHTRAPVRSTNSISCVIRVSNGRRSALLTGDIEQAQEAILVQQLTPFALQSDVLLLPHHGSKTSSSAQFLDSVQPRIALVQAGYRNRFGHPAELVQARLRERGIVVLDTPHCGAVQWRSDNPHTPICTRQLAPRYWWHQVP